MPTGAGWRFGGPLTQQAQEFGAALISERTAYCFDEFVHSGGLLFGFWGTTVFVRTPAAVVRGAFGRVVGAAKIGPLFSQIRAKFFASYGAGGSALYVGAALGGYLSHTVPPLTYKGR